MFVISGRELQTKLKEIRKRIMSGEEAILHGQADEPDLVLVTLERYNELLRVERAHIEEIMEWYYNQNPELEPGEMSELGPGKT